MVLGRSFVLESYGPEGSTRSFALDFLSGIDIDRVLYKRVILL